MSMVFEKKKEAVTYICVQVEVVRVKRSKKKYSHKRFVLCYFRPLVFTTWRELSELRKV